MRLYLLLLPIIGIATVTATPLAPNDQGIDDRLVLYDDYGALHEYDYPLPRPTTDQGWLTRWLAMGGEGKVVVHMDYAAKYNITVPHRPSAFPSHLQHPLPLSGILIPFPALSSDPNADLHACSASPIQRPPASRKPPFKIALVERGGCDFATKVRAAQEAGARGVVVGDTVARAGETVEEGRRREGLITMFSPEDTDDVAIPSVFVSRASYLLLLDLLNNQTDSGHSNGTGLWIEVSEGSDEGGTLSSLLSFAILMPSLFLLATIAVHRFRVAQQREADRAPATVVLSLPERIWAPDIVWEKDDSEESAPTSPNASSRLADVQEGVESAGGNTVDPATWESREGAETSEEVESRLSALPPSHRPALSDSPLSLSKVPLPASPVPSTSPSPSIHSAGPSRPSKPKKHRRQYYSKDECAICMDSFEKGDVVRILPCGHVFHKEECDEWLMKWRKLCPTCRADVTLPPVNFIGSNLTPVAAPLIPSSPSSQVSHIVVAAVTVPSTNHHDPRSPGAGVIGRLSEVLGTVRESTMRILGRGGVRLDDGDRDLPVRADGDERV